MFTLTLLFWIAVVVAILRWHGMIDPLDWQLWKERIVFHGKMFSIGFVDTWIGVLGIRQYVKFPAPPRWASDRGHHTAGMGSGLAATIVLIAGLFVAMLALCSLLHAWYD